MSDSLDGVAREYVSLVLALGVHDAGYVHRDVTARNVFIGEGKNVWSACHISPVLVSCHASLINLTIAGIPSTWGVNGLTRGSPNFDANAR